MKVGGTYWGGRWGLSGEEGGDLVGRRVETYWGGRIPELRGKQKGAEIHQYM